MKKDARPIGEVLNGLELRPLPEGVVALEAVVLLKCIDEDGDTGWWWRGTAGVTVVETIGIAHAICHQATTQFTSGWYDDDEGGG